MRFLLYVPHLYGLGLLVIGFLVSRLRERNLYFWACLLLAQLTYLGWVIFLVDGFGLPIYAPIAAQKGKPLPFTGLYIAASASFLGIVGGAGLYFWEKKAFPGIWILGLSALEVVVLGILWLTF
ncbi:MAG: hypothetical protein D6750_05915 [Bacteroidetes bacterium]|nr:MAG: hypothetical protein D6750_05915 [Bacteroidota bacterium]